MGKLVRCNQKRKYVFCSTVRRAIRALFSPIGREKVVKEQYTVITNAANNNEEYR